MTVYSFIVRQGDNICAYEISEARTQLNPAHGKWRQVIIMMAGCSSEYVKNEYESLLNYFKHYRTPTRLQSGEKEQILPYLKTLSP